MRLGKIIGKVAPLIAVAAMAGLSACDRIDTSFAGDEGVPLAELDMSGDPPSGVALGGPDTVVITSGSEFTIEVEGSDLAQGRMRFALNENVLAIGRESGNWDDDEIATVNITMPPPSELVLGGSGRITADAMADSADIVVGGSGTAEVSNLAANDLSVVLGGSGRLTARGTAENLDIVIGGSGSADLADLVVDTADVNIGGSGNATFASDGTVEANIAGSGTVRVRGSANCTVNSVGSGTLVCEEGEVTEE